MPTLLESIGLTALIGIGTAVCKHIGNSAKHLNGKQHVEKVLCDERSENIADTLVEIKAELKQIREHLLGEQK